MFDRNIKLKFNEMKYTKLTAEKSLALNFKIARRDAYFARIIFLICGFNAAKGILNTDIQKYSALKGVNRWRHRVENVRILFELFRCCLDIIMDMNLVYIRKILRIWKCYMEDIMDTMMKVMVMVMVIKMDMEMGMKVLRIKVHFKYR
jgi:hypothetical protein